jgi:hypothetical protein
VGGAVVGGAVVGGAVVGGAVVGGAVVGGAVVGDSLAAASAAVGVASGDGEPVVVPVGHAVRTTSAATARAEELKSRRYMCS